MLSGFCSGLGHCAKQYMQGSWHWAMYAVLGIPVWLQSMLYDTFKCVICQSTPMVPPVILSNFPFSVCWSNFSFSSNTHVDLMYIATVIKQGAWEQGYCKCMFSHVEEYLYHHCWLVRGLYSCPTGQLITDPQLYYTLCDL